MLLGFLICICNWFKFDISLHWYVLWCMCCHLFVTVAFCYSSNHLARQYTGGTLLPVNSSQLQLVLFPSPQLRFL